MFNDIIKLNYEEDFTAPLPKTYRGSTKGYYLKLEKPDVFDTKGIIGYSVVKNQIVCINTSRDVVTKGWLKDTVATYPCEKFSHLEDLYIYYRLSPDDKQVSKFVTNKLILEPLKQEVVIPEDEKFLGEVITRQQIISHEKGGWCIVTYNSVTDKIIACSERFDYK